MSAISCGQRVATDPISGYPDRRRPGPTIALSDGMTITDVERYAALASARADEVTRLAARAEGRLKSARMADIVGARSDAAEAADAATLAERAADSAGHWATEALRAAAGLDPAATPWSPLTTAALAASTARGWAQVARAWAVEAARVAASKR